MSITEVKKGKNEMKRDGSRRRACANGESGLRVNHVFLALAVGATSVAPKESSSIKAASQPVRRIIQRTRLLVERMIQIERMIEGFYREV